MSISRLGDLRLWLTTSAMSMLLAIGFLALTIDSILNNRISATATECIEGWSLVWCALTIVCYAASYYLLVVGLFLRYCVATRRYASNRVASLRLKHV
jgi:hypothetical protein